MRAELRGGRRAAYGPVHVIAVWEPAYDQPIVLVTTLADLDAAVAAYRKRAHSETLFSDQKSRGLHIHRSHRSDPTRLARFLIATALPYLWVILLGVDARQHAAYGRFHRPDRCDLSLFQLGLRLLAYCLRHRVPIPRPPFAAAAANRSYVLYGSESYQSELILLHRSFMMMIMSDITQHRAHSTSLIALRSRVLIALVIGICSGLLCAQYQSAFGRADGDLLSPRCAGQALLDGRDPYGCPHLMSDGTQGPSNPLTTALVLLPLAPFAPNLAAGTFFGLSSAMLAFGLLQQGSWWHLLVFLAFPYWAALQAVQWSPLLMSVALFPQLLPLTLVKPHIGLPIALTWLTWRRALVTTAFGLATLLLDPTWPWHWLAQTTSYDGFIPLLTFPGPLLLTALVHWRRPMVRFGILLAAVPQRLFYDQLLLWLLPATPRAMLMLTLGSWMLYLVYLTAPAIVTPLSIVALYVPALISACAAAGADPKGL